MITKRKRSESPLQINAPKNSQSSEERPDSRSRYSRLPAIKWDRWRERHWPAHKLLLPFHTSHLSSFLLVVQIQLGGHLILSWIWWCWFRLVLENTPFSVIPHLAHTFASLLDRSEGPRELFKCEWFLKGGARTFGAGPYPSGVGACYYIYLFFFFFKPFSFEELGYWF